jgi:predicted transcriptional regulator
MAETTTITVSKRVAERLRAIVRERGHVDETALADEAITQQLDIDEAWKEEIQTILDTPRAERRFVSHEEVGEWIRSQRTDNPLPRPTGKPRP